MKTFTVNGENQYINCQIDSDEKPIGSTTQQINVLSNTPLLLATLCNPNTGAPLLSDNVKMTITAPDGTVYNQSANSRYEFVSVVKDNVYVVCIVNPKAGLWKIVCSCANSCSYRVNLIAFPTTNQISTAMTSMSPHFAQPDFLRGDQLTYERYKWIYWPVFVLLKAIQAQSFLLLDLNNLLTSIFGSPTTYNKKIVAQIKQQSIEGINITLAQTLGFATEDVYEEVLLNGAANDGLEDWTIVESNGNGWSVQKNYAASIQYNTNFAVSEGWSIKSQLIDLVNDVGLTPAYLDKSPSITIREFVTALYQSPEIQSQYFLNIELRGEKDVVIKRIETGNIALTEASGQTVSTLEWQGLSFFFENYGTGVRYVYFEHGGMNSAKFSSEDFGVKMTGASVKIQLLLPEQPGANLLENGSAENGIVGWTLAPGSSTWTVETNTAIACPGSPGKNDFSSLKGIATKYQEINLLSKGYSAEFLDEAPLINFYDWLCINNDCQCSYRWQFDLLDSNKSVIAHFDSGMIKFPITVLTIAPYIRFTKAFTNYGSGLRYIRFQHSASSDKTGIGAKLTGASVVLSSTTNKVINKPEFTPASNLKTPGQLVENTTIAPYKWVCYLHAKGRSATGWLTPQEFPNVRMLGTVAHTIKSGKYDWPEIVVIPAAGNGKDPYISPFSLTKVPINHCQVPYEWLVNSQTQIDESTLYDFGALYVDESLDWDLGGFVPTINKSDKFKATKSGYPAITNARFNPEKLIHGDMYTESLNVTKYRDSEYKTDSKLGQGSSGSCLYAKNNDNYEAYAMTSSFNSYGAYATRINDLVLSRFNNWKKRLSPDDVITKFQTVIRTGDILGAGTDANKHAVIDGKVYELEKLWVGGASFFRSRNERGDYDGYNLTARINELYPNGAKVSDLLGKDYSINIEFSTLGINLDIFFLSNENWFVESVAFFVNDQMLYAKNFNRWLQHQGDDVLTDTINL